MLLLRSFQLQLHLSTVRSGRMPDTTILGTFRMKKSGCSCIFAVLGILSLSESWLSPCQINIRSYANRIPGRSLSIPPTLFAGNDRGREYLMEVTYEGRSCQVPIYSNETILNGLERAQTNDLLAIPELPSDCRRGNCLTCVGRHSIKSQESSLQRGEDGLSPEVSRQISKKGYVLTCSSKVVGSGVKLELGENHNAWKEVYYNRLTDESTQYVARAAIAKTIRLSNERNLDRWAQKTEMALKQSGVADDEL